MRQGRDRLVSMTTDTGGSVLACHVSQGHFNPKRLELLYGNFIFNYILEIIVGG